MYVLSLRFTRSDGCLSQSVCEYAFVRFRYRAFFAGTASAQAFTARGDRVLNDIINFQTRGGISV